MAVGPVLERQLAALPVQKARGIRSGDDRTDGRQYNTRLLREPGKRRAARFRDSAEDLVIVAARDHGLDTHCALSENERRCGGNGDARHVDNRRNARGRAELGEVAGKTVGHIHRGTGVARIAFANLLRGCGTR